MKPNAEEIRAHLRYVKTTGHLWWKIRASGRVMWRPAGSIDKNGYIGIGFGGKVFKAHHLAWLIVTGDWPRGEIDHKNLNRADNKWKNLREATRGQNQSNSRKYRNNTSGFKGVCWHKQHRKWYAQLQSNGKQVFLGLFDDPAIAAVAYAKGARRHHGEFARLK